MNNNIAKEILSAYRPGGEDARDENFREALDQCENDPEMKDWFADQLNFDREMARALQSIHGPEAGKRSILAALPFDRANQKRRLPARWWGGIAGLGMAAALAFGLIFDNLQPPAAETNPAFQLALAPLAQSARPFDFQSPNSANLIGWLRERGHPIPTSLPEIVLQAEAVGCKVFQDQNGHEISLICFQLEGEIVHIFAFSEATRELLPKSSGWWTEGEWSFYALQDDNLVFATTSRPERFSELS